MKKTWVISLGGSRIIPREVDDKFLLKFKELINSHPSQKFVIVTGGGSTARKYILALKKLGKNTKTQSKEGIDITRLHAKFMMSLFGKAANDKLPLTMKKVKSLLKKNRIVFCGALRYRDKNTTDGTAAKIANYLRCPFINLTNTKGIYSAETTKNKKAKFIPEITWKELLGIAKKIKYEAGQHFVLDQSAAKTIQNKKIATYIVGSLGAINNILKGKKFEGTLIKG